MSINPTKDKSSHTPPHRPPPPMRIVTKGWWTLEEQEAQIKELEKEDPDERK